MTYAELLRRVRAILKSQSPALPEVPDHIIAKYLRDALAAGTIEQAGDLFFTTEKGEAHSEQLKRELLTSVRKAAFN